MFPAVLTLVAVLATPSQNPDYFVVKVVDSRTGRGVPLIELRTTHSVSYVTDSNGVAAIREPGLAGEDVFFHVSGHGYEYPKDGFGFRGKALRVTPGATATLSVRRINIAERLYRVTGGGIYADSVLAGLPVPLKEPTLNARVVGSDSVVNAVYSGKIYWFWGDTNHPRYPLGNFNVTGATSELPGNGGLDPNVGINLSYFTRPDGTAEEMARMPGQGPTWITSVVPLGDPKGPEQLYATYVKVEPPLKVYAHGIAVFDDAKQVFRHLAEIPLTPSAGAMLRTFRHTEAGTEYVYFANPFPIVRVRATATHVLNPAEYESFTCLKDGTRIDDRQLDRGPDDRLRYAWRKNTPVVGPKEESKFLAAGSIKPEDVRWRLRDRDSGKAVISHVGSVYWNAYRRRWVMIAVQSDGTSYLGEVWYAEAATPVGPWSYAVKVVTHEKYSFYNPKQHPMLDKENGRVIFFEGTYTNMFSGNPLQTPRYEYNQVMYKLDLSDSRLALPVAVYEAAGGQFSTVAPHGDARPAFFAYDRAGNGTVPVLCSENRLVLGQSTDRDGLFSAFPSNTKDPPAVTVPLYEFRPQAGGRTTYSIKPSLTGYVRAEQPLCRVWPAD